MLVLTKPSLKPLKSSSTATPPPKAPDQPISDPDPNQISLRPLGHTGPASSLSFPARTSEPDKNVSAPAPFSVSTKPDRFVPPHLRPGFVRKDEKPGLASSSILGLPHLEQQQPRQGYVGYGQAGRVGMRGFVLIRKTWVDQDPAGTDPAPPVDDELAGLMYSLGDR